MITQLLTYRWNVNDATTKMSRLRKKVLPNTKLK
jgi:hypothetical protein